MEGNYIAGRLPSARPRRRNLQTVIWIRRTGTLKLNSLLSLSRERSRGLPTKAGVSRTLRPGWRLIKGEFQGLGWYGSPRRSPLGALKSNPRRAVALLQRQSGSDVSGNALRRWRIHVCQDSDHVSRFSADPQIAIHARCAAPVAEAGHAVLPVFGEAIGVLIAERRVHFAVNQQFGVYRVQQLVPLEGNRKPVKIPDCRVTTPCRSAAVG